MIETDHDGGIATLRLAHGKASALDLEFLRAIARAVDDVAASDAKAVILTGTGSIFSAGVDLVRLLECGDAYLDEFLPALDAAFRALFFLPKPLVVACNGHAIAGGCVMLACGDARIGARGNGTVGAPELRVGVPFPLLALEILRASIPRDSVQALIYSGETYSMEDSRALGLLDSLVAPAELMDAARAKAERMASYPAAAFADTKSLMRAPAARRLREDGAVHARTVRELWGSPAVREAVQGYVERTLRR